MTSLVHGNGAYALAGFTKPSVDINGVELVVFYNDGNSANNRDVVLFNGNDSNIAFTGPPADPAGWDVTLNGINYKSGSASLDLVVSDGQSFPDGAVVVNTTTLAPTGEIFDGNTVPNASASSATQSNGGLWDFKSFPITSVLKPGPNTLHLTSAYDDDCLSLIVAAVNLPAGSAPNQPPRPRPPPNRRRPPRPPHQPRRPSASHPHSPDSRQSRRDDRPSNLEGPQTASRPDPTLRHRSPRTRRGSAP